MCFVIADFISNLMTTVREKQKPSVMQIVTLIFVHNEAVMVMFVARSFNSKLSVWCNATIVTDST